MNGFKINSLTAYVSVLPDGDEGVMGKRMGNVYMPLIGADEKRLKEYFPIAKKIADAEGCSFRVLRFDLVEDITEEVKAKYEK